MTSLAAPTSVSLAAGRPDAAVTHGCRFCGTPLTQPVVDLGKSPLCESYLRADQLDRMEPFYPLKVWVCTECFLVQVPEYVSGEEIFTEYAYFSSFSDSWLDHCRRYADQMIDQLGLTRESRVVEVASNDGYCLQWFVKRDIPCLGIEPAANVAKVAEEKGVPTLVRFFGRELASEMVAVGRTADLLFGKNVLAQVPDINDFVAGLKMVLAPGGTITIEFPHLARTIEGNQFDQVYHEHFYYFSYLAAERILAAHGLTLFDVEEVPTHGGSLRIYARHEDEIGRPVTERAEAVRERELAAGTLTVGYYESFARQVEATKRDLLAFLIEAKRQGKRIVGYGAPGKGNTLLNYCGIRTDFLDFTVDRNTYKQGRFTPGTQIPIRHPDAIREARPDYVLILPWNIKDEIARQLAYVREWGGQLVVAIPTVQVL